MNEKEIWQGLNQKDPKAFEYIYAIFYSDLIRYGLKIYADLDVVKDAIHDMMVQLFERKSGFQEVHNIKAYLLVMLRNKLYDQLKSKPTEELSEKINQTLSVPNCIEWVIGEEAIHQETRKVQEVIDTLPSKQREVIHLRFYENISLSEIAEIMQINYQSVQNLLQRALKSLSENMIIQEVKQGGTLFFQFLSLGKPTRLLSTTYSFFQNIYIKRIRIDSSKNT